MSLRASWECSSANAIRCRNWRRGDAERSQGSISCVARHGYPEDSRLSIRVRRMSWKRISGAPRCRSSLRSGIQMPPTAICGPSSLTAPCMHRRKPFETETSCVRPYWKTWDGSTSGFGAWTGCLTASVSGSACWMRLMDVCEILS